MAEIRNDLKKYLEKIISEYKMFDRAHGVEHIYQVIDRSISLAEKTDADKEMVCTIAAYHDIGMSISRENHGFYSAKILLSDLNLNKWFSKKQLEIMAQAIEDHSSSLEKEPRTLYGKIIYQADKVLDAETVITRAVLYGIANYSDYSIEEHLERIYQYINNKYGEQGRYKLWINIPEERGHLQELQRKIINKDYIRDICLKYLS